MVYRNRIADTILEEKLETFGAVNIVGPKGCGKTTTAKHFAKSYIELQDEDLRDGYLETAELRPSFLLRGEKPRLIDEWQDAPKLWGAVRKSVDDEGKPGLYILTGSTSRKVSVPHTGTMRISTMVMRPMSLWESGESNGKVSLSSLLREPGAFEECDSDLSFEDLIYAICRGGWPGCLSLEDPKRRLGIAKDLVNQIYGRDLSSVDGRKKRSAWAELLLRSYARNICTEASLETIYEDTLGEAAWSKRTFGDYLDALEALYIVEDVEAWSPAIRSKTVIRASKKRNFCDPSIAVAALGLSPEYFDQDLKTLGFLFESLCLRDLRIYASKEGGRLSYYRDRRGLEADAVLHLPDGRYALFECKLGYSGMEEGAKNLLKIEKLVGEAGLRMPSFKAILTAEEYGYRRPDGVYVIPIGCLKD